jgi:hypothetical protein
MAAEHAFSQRIGKAIEILIMAAGAVVMAAAAMDMAHGQAPASVNRRNELLNPKMTPQEVEDVVAYLNATYYKFPIQTAGASK